MMSRQMKINRADEAMMPVCKVCVVLSQGTCYNIYINCNAKGDVQWASRRTLYGVLQPLPIR